MPRLSCRNPSYRKHKASGQAVVTLSGRDVYLGEYGSDASRREYDRVLAEWLAAGRPAPAPRAGGQEGAGAQAGDRDGHAYVNELLSAYRAHAESYYSGGEYTSVCLVLKLLRRLYGQTPIRDFGPVAAKALRQRMVEAGWVRTYINLQMGRLRRVFKWGVEQEMVPAFVLQRLQAVSALKWGRTEAREGEPVRPVPEEAVAATLPHLSRQLRTMVELQLITGMRPGEVSAMRTCDVDRSGPIWTYRPASHKTRHHGHERTVYLGPRAQRVLGPWLRPDLTAYLFQPAEAEAERRARLTAARKTPPSCGNRVGSNRQRRPRVKPGERYTATSYAVAIARACDKAFGMPGELRKAKRPPVGATPAEAAECNRLLAAAAAWRREHSWHPHQLRHTAATRLRKEYGLEAAQVILGHRTLTVTQIYAEKNVEAARRIMGEVG